MLVAIAGVRGGGIAGVEGPGTHRRLALVVGVLVGLAVRADSAGPRPGSPVNEAGSPRSSRHPRSSPLPFSAYTGTLLVGGNGFVAAFVGGLVFGNVAGRGGEKEVFRRAAGRLASMISWLIFGALAVPVIRELVELGASSSTSP